MADFNLDWWVLKDYHLIAAKQLSLSLKLQFSHLYNIVFLVFIWYKAGSVAHQDYYRQIISVWVCLNQLKLHLLIINVDVKV